MSYTDSVAYDNDTDRRDWLNNEHDAPDAADTVDVPDLTVAETRAYAEFVEQHPGFVPIGITADLRVLSVPALSRDDIRAVQDARAAELGIDLGGDAA